MLIAPSLDSGHWPSIVRQNSLFLAESDAVFFVLPIIGNDLHHYFVLGEALRPMASLLGLRFSELRYSALARPNPLEKFAHAAALKIIERLDRREINLVGLSAAGIFACETAKHLNALGYDINSLVFFDSHSAGFEKIRLSFLPNFIGFSLRKIKWWFRRKGDLAIFPSFREFQFNAQLAAQLADWSPIPIQANKVFFFKPQDGDVDDAQIEKWQRTAKGRLVVIPTRGGHISLTEPDVALHVAQRLTEDLK